MTHDTGNQQSSVIQRIQIMDIWWFIGHSICSDIRVTKGLRVHNSNLVNIRLALTGTIKIRSGHNFTHPTTAKLSFTKVWSDWIIKIKITR